MYLMKINFNKFKLFYFNRNSVIFRRNQISLLTSSVEYYLRRRQKRIGFFRQNSISFVPSGGGVVFSPFSDACFVCAIRIRTVRNCTFSRSDENHAPGAHSEIKNIAGDNFSQKPCVCVFRLFRGIFKYIYIYVCIFSYRRNGF